MTAADQRLGRDLGRKRDTDLDLGINTDCTIGLVSARAKALAVDLAHADQPERYDSAPTRAAAMHRVLDYYLHTAMAAAQRFSPFRSPLRLAPSQPGVVPADIADKDQAMAWFDAEVAVLMALIGYASANGYDSHAWQLPWTLGPFFHRRGRWRDYASSQRTALAAAQRLDDQLALAHAHYLLGHAQSQMSDYDAAEPNFHQALDIFRQLEDRANEAVVLNGLAGMLERQERYPEALAVALDALRMLRAVGHWWTQATLENGVGWLYAHLGQYHDALTHCQRALSLHRESGHRGGAADTLDSLGYIYLHLGDLAQAQAHYQQAIEAYREIGAPVGEAHSQAGLGDVLGRGDDSRMARATARGQHRVGRVAPSAARLLAVVAGMLPAADRDRYAEEYRSELWEIAHAGQSRRRQLYYAFRQVVSFPRLYAELRVPRRRGAAP